MTKLTLIAAQRPHLQTPSHQILRLCHMNFEETQNLSPYLAKTVGIYLSHLHLPVHWDLGDSGSTSWASLPDRGWIRFCAIRLSSSLNHLLAKTCSSHEESQELSFTFPWITHAKNHWSKQIKLSKLKVKSKKYTPSTVRSWVGVKVKVFWSIVWFLKLFYSRKHSVTVLTLLLSKAKIFVPFFFWFGFVWRFLHVYKLCSSCNIFVYASVSF